MRNVGLKKYNASKKLGFKGQVKKALVTSIFVLSLTTSLFAASVGDAKAVEAPNLSSEMTFIPKDNSRSYMDRAGVWNGSSEVTPYGDGFRFVITNNSGYVTPPEAGQPTAYNVIPTFTAPAGFSFTQNLLNNVPSISFVDCTQTPVITGVDLNNNDQELVVHLNSDDFDMNPQCQVTIDLGLVASASVSEGSYNVNGELVYALAEDADVNQIENNNINVQVNKGHILVTKTPIVQTKAVGDNVSWNVTVLNTGEGGLFDIAVDESAIDLNPGLTLLSLSSQHPFAAVSGDGNSISIPYLAAGEQFIVVVSATVDGCYDISNVAQIAERTGEENTSIEADVQLDLQTPLVDFNLNNVQLKFGTPVAVMTVLENTNHGTATNVVVDTNLETLPITVSNVSNVWSYNAVNGTFTYLGADEASATGDENLVNGEQVILSFDATLTDQCGEIENIVATWTPGYVDVCGNTYNTPARSQAYLDPNDRPSALVTKTASDSRLFIGDSGYFDIDVNSNNVDYVEDGTVVVTDTLPSYIENITISSVPSGSTVSCPGGTCEAGETLTWTIPNNVLDNNPDIRINFDASSNVCDGGNVISNNASLSGLSIDPHSCLISSSAQSDILLANTIGGSATHEFNVAAAPNGEFEEGSASSNTTRDLGEGEFITFTSMYEFDNGFAGRWSDATYTDDFAGVAGQTLVGGSAQYTITRLSDNATVTDNIPAGSITSSTGSFVVDLGFMTNVKISGNQKVGNFLDGFSVVITYKTTVPNSAGNTTLSQKATLSISGGDATADACSANGAVSYSDAVFVPVRQASAELTVTAPSVIGVCEPFNMTLTATSSGVGNNPIDPSNILLELLKSTSKYDLADDLNIVSPVEGGDFVGNLTTSFAGNGNPLFTHTQSELANEGSVTFRVMRTDASNLADKTLSSVLRYDNNETQLAGSRVFSDVFNYTPSSILSADLSVLTSPQNLMIVDDQAEWVIYVINGGSAPAYNATLEEVFASGVIPNKAETDLANAGNPYVSNAVLSDAGQTMTWDLGNIGAGETREVHVVVDINSGAGNFEPLANGITAEWGCTEDEMVQAVSAERSALLFANGHLHVSHVANETSTEMCFNTYDTIVVQNAGDANLFNVVVQEDINTLTNGVELATMPMWEYSIDGGMNWLPFDNNPLVFGSLITIDQNAVALLGEMGTIATNSPATPQEIQLRFMVYSPEATFSQDDITFDTLVNAELINGDPVDPASDSFVFNHLKPNLVVTKRGINLDENGIDRNNYDVTAIPENLWLEEVFGGRHDFVVWRMVIENVGNSTAQNIRLEDIYPDTGPNTELHLEGPITGIDGPYNQSNTIVAIDDMAPGATQTVYILQHVGPYCIRSENVATASWGCIDNDKGGTKNNSNITTPESTGVVIWDEIPDFTNIHQDISPLANGETHKLVTMTNEGGTASNIVIEENLPDGYSIDGDIIIKVDGVLYEDAIVELNLGTPDPNDYLITFPGIQGNNPGFELRFGHTVTLEMDIIADGFADMTADEFINYETVANALDPEVPASGDNVVTINYTSSCDDFANSNTSTETFDPATPDVDLQVTPLPQVVEPGETYEFDVELINNGEVGSIADDITFTTEYGAGWDNVQVSVIASPNGANGVCPAGVCDSNLIGTLFDGDTATIRITATALSTGSLKIGGTVEGALNDTFNYSYDKVRVKCIGVNLTKEVQSTSEDFTTDPQVAIGEEVVFKLTTEFYGLEQGESIENILLRDTLPQELSLKQYDIGGANTSTILTSTLDASPIVSGVALTPPLANNGIVEFTLDDVVTNGTKFEALLTTVVRKVVANPDGTQFTNNFGASMTAYGETYASNNPADGFGGTFPELHDEVTLDIIYSILQVNKRVYNADKQLPDWNSQTSFGEVGDTMAYRILVSNIGNAPLFDLTASDIFQSNGITVQTNTQLPNSIGADNTGDNVIDALSDDSVLVNVSPSELFFTHDNTKLVDGVAPFTTLDRLDPGETVYLFYRGLVNGNEAPGAVIRNEVTVQARTVEGSEDDETLVEEDSFAEVEMLGINFFKRLINTSTPDTNDTPLQDDPYELAIAEQVEFEIELNLPQGVIPDLIIKDTLPENMRLIELSANDVIIGSDITQTAPIVTPTAPADGPVEITWDFGQRTVSGNNNTIIIRYKAQVRNIIANTDGTTFENTTRFTYNGSIFQDAVTVGMEIVEANVDVDKTVDVATPIDAGDIVTYTIKIENVSGSNVPAYNLDVNDTLPVEMEYVPGSVVYTNLPAGLGGLADPDLVANTLTLGRSQAAPQDIDLNDGEYIEFTVQAKALDTVEPNQMLQNEVIGDWYSLDGQNVNLGISLGSLGSSYGIRDGSSEVAPNDNRDSATRTVFVSNLYSVAKSIESVAPVTGGYRIGDEVQYRIDITFQEGTVDEVVIEDVLPDGFGYVDIESITPVSNGIFTYTAPTDPTITGPNLSWDFGTVVNTGDNDVNNNTLSLIYNVQVLDDGLIPPIPTTQLATNTTRMDYVDYEDGDFSTNTDDEDVNVVQPLLTIFKNLAVGQSSTVEAGDTVNYTLQIENIGDAPAYNAVIQDILPEGLNDATPVNISATLGGVPVMLPAPMYMASTITWTLPDNIVIEPGLINALVIEYQVVVDDTVGAGAMLGNSATVEAYYSLESANEDAEDRREYDPTQSSTAYVYTPSPDNMGKTVNKLEANIGEKITYTLRIPDDPVGVQLFDVRVFDTLPDGLIFDDYRITSGHSINLGQSFLMAPSLVFAFDEIPADEQLVIEIDAIIENSADTGNDGDLIQFFLDQASFNYSDTDGGQPQPQPIFSPEVRTDITEPRIAVTKVLKEKIYNTEQGVLQGGDQVVYTITATNSGDGDAFDVSLRDIAHEDLINPTASGDVNGAPVLLGSAGGNNTWEWIYTGPLAKLGGQITFDITFTIDNDVQIFEQLDDVIVGEWTSTAGPNVNERDGSGSFNDYIDDDNEPVSVTIGGLELDKVELNGGGTYAIGEDVTYRITYEQIRGAVDNVVISDILPAGMKFVSASFTTDNMQRQGGGAVTLLSEPTFGDTGLIEFDFGDVTAINGSGIKPTIVLDVVARLTDSPSLENGDQVTNNAKVTFEEGQIVYSDNNVTITVVEPELVLGFDGPLTTQPGVPELYTVRVEHYLITTSTSPAYRPIVQVQLPAEMKNQSPLTATTPPTVLITGGIRGVVNLVENTDYTLAYDSGTGIMTVTTLTNTARIELNEVMQIVFEGEVESGTPDSTLIDNPIATVTEYRSIDPSVAADEVRITTTALGAGTVGTPNGVTGDDETDDVAFEFAAPDMVVTKVANPGTVRPTDTVEYTVVITNNGGADALNTTFEDNLDSNYVAGTLQLVDITPPLPVGANIVVNPNGGNNSTGLVQITNLIVGPQESYEIKYSAETKPALPSGTVLLNQGVLNATGINEVISDDPTYDDGNDTGNNPQLTGDDDPTRVFIESEADIEIFKTSDQLPDATPALLPGDILVYNIIITNDGDENLIGTTFQDSIPTNTTYVPGTTTLNGSLVPDVAGSSALETGFLINTPGQAPGVVLTSQDPDFTSPITISFQVQINDNVVNGAIISNQGELRGLSEGTETPVLEVSDDPDTPAIDDPTRDVVAGLATVEAQKLVEDLNGGYVMPNDTLRYSIDIINIGSNTLTDIAFEDLIPSNALYVFNTIKLNGNTLTDNIGDDDGEFVPGLGTNGGIVVIIPELLGGQIATVTFDVTVNNTAQFGEIVSNQGVVSTSQTNDELTDDDGDESNGDNPTEVVVGGLPVLDVTKTASDVNGNVLLPNETILYTIIVENVGATTAFNVELQDDGPVEPIYVPGSLFIDGNQIDPFNPNLPLIPGVLLGELPAGEFITIQYKMTVPSDAENGDIYENQAVVDYTHDGCEPNGYLRNGYENGCFQEFTVLSDSDYDDGEETGNDPTDPNDDDPTIIQVNGAIGSGAISGYVWQGINNNTNRFAVGNVFKEGWFVDIFNDNDDLVATLVTDSNGYYEVYGLAPVSNGYRIQFRAPSDPRLWGVPTSGLPNDAIPDGTIFGPFIIDLPLIANTVAIEQNLPIAVQGVVYDAVERTPVAGALYTILLGGPEGPIAGPDCIHPLQQSQLTTEDGQYFFSVLPTCEFFGDFYIEITPPGQFSPIYPSQLIVPQAGSFTPTGNPGTFSFVVPLSSAPQAGQPTLWYTAFNLNPEVGAVANNHIPVDPVLGGSITVVKLVSKRYVSRGDLVPYTMIYTNNDNNTIPNIDLVDNVPPGFKYVRNSATIDGVANEPVISGRQLEWAGQTFGPNQVKTIRMLLVVGSGVGTGKYINEAYALNALNDNLVSNIAEAEVQVVPDEVFDCSEVIGKVFDDKNMNGYQEEDEPGIAGVTIATVNGLLITTDNYGRYHVACADIPNEMRGSNYILKVNERTLPTGYRITTENPRVIRLTRGKMSKANFGATLGKVMRLDIFDSGFVGDTEIIHNDLVQALDSMIDMMQDNRYTIRLSYRSFLEDKKVMKRRIRRVSKYLEEQWKLRGCCYDIEIEEELVQASAAPAGLTRYKLIHRYDITVEDGKKFTVEDPKYTSPGVVREFAVDTVPTKQVKGRN